MTDNEIIKALECCIRPAGQQSCFDCPLVKRQGCCSTFLIQNVLDLINRQQAEIKEKDEMLKAQADTIFLYERVVKDKNAEIESLKHRKTELQIRNQELQHEKSEAIKEFAEELKHFIIPQKADGYTREIVLKRDIDNLVKEMTEE